MSANMHRSASSATLADAAKAKAERMAIARQRAMVTLTRMYPAEFVMLCSAELAALDAQEAMK